MIFDLRRDLKSFLRRIHLAPEGREHSVSAHREKYAVEDDGKDIEGVLETFRQLVTQVSHDGKEIGDLCARAEKKAARYALLSETVVESVTSGILVVDRSDRVLLANSAAKRILDIGPETNVAGMDLGALFKDGREFRYLVRRCLETGQNASRKIREVVTLAGKHGRLGVSTSCVRPDPPSADAVIVVFASLGDESGSLPESDDEAREAVERQSYLRGVLDSYDLIAGLVADFSRIESRSNKGTLTTTELREFSGSIRRACDTMMAFALSLGVIDSAPELVDVNSLLESVVARTGLNADPRLRSLLAADLPRVRTVPNVLEVGLGLLLKGCMSQSQEGVEMASVLEDGASQYPVTVHVKELSPTRPVRRIGRSLREFIGGGDMQREAAIFLLSRLPKKCHNLQVEQVDGFFHFSIKMGTPIDREAGQSGRGGDSSDRGRDDNR
jgi:PAS domain-containing protein